MGSDMWGQVKPGGKGSGRGVHRLLFVRTADERGMVSDHGHTYLHAYNQVACCMLHVHGWVTHDEITLGGASVVPSKKGVRQAPTLWAGTTPH